MNNPTESEIRGVAYQIWKARGRYPHLFCEKSAQDDWNTAADILRRGEIHQIKNIQHLFEMATKSLLS